LGAAFVLIFFLFSQPSAERLSSPKTISPTTFTPGSDHPPTLVRSYDFDRTGRAEGWERPEAPGQLSVTGGFLHLPKAATSDITISKALKADTQQFDAIAVRIVDPKVKGCTVTWQPELGGAGSVTQRRASQDQGGYTFYLAVGKDKFWRRRIKRLTLSFDDASQQVKIDWIRLFKAGDQFFLKRAGRLGYVIADELEWIIPMKVPANLKQTVQIRQDGRLVVNCGLSKEIWQNHTGEVSLKIAVQPEQGESQSAAIITLCPKAQRAPWRWMRKQLNLEAFAGQRVTLRFETHTADQKTDGFILITDFTAQHKATKSAATRPNFLILLVDALRPDHLSTYGYSRPTSPNLDLLAKESLVFENAFAQSHCTNFSVPTLFTSRLPLETKTKQSSYYNLSPDLVMLPQTLQEAGYSTVAFCVNPLIHWDYGYDAGFDAFYQGHEKGEALNEKALTWLKTNAPQPFFIYLHYMDVHGPYCAPEKYRAPFLSGIPSPTDQAVRYGQITEMLDQMETGKVYRREEQEYLRALYDGGINYTDWYIGELLAQLKQMGLYENTVIIVLADHGEEFWEHGGLGHGGQLYDELLRVPLIIKLPAAFGFRGKRLTTPARIIDIYPTIMELAGLSSPSRLRGKSLLAADAGEKCWLYAEAPEMAALRDRSWKFIDKPGSLQDELYNLEKDPAEIKNVIARYPERAAQMQAQIAKFTKSAKSATSAHQEQKSIDPKTFERLKSLGYLK